MKLARFDSGTGPRIGVVHDNHITATSFIGSMTTLISNWDELKSDIAASSGGVPPRGDPQSLLDRRLV